MSDPAAVAFAKSRCFTSNELWAAAGGFDAHQRYGELQNIMTEAGWAYLIAYDAWFPPSVITELRGAHV